jgi:SPP1 gp7 family putative phage head morphogenesis protein
MTTSNAVGSYRSQAKFARERFQTASSLELEYLRNLRQVVRQIDSIIKVMAPDGVVKNPDELNTALRRYSEMIRPWARAAAEKMVARVAQRGEAAWFQMGRDMGRNLKKELETAPTGAAMREIMEAQVDLITSIPLDAAQRVHKLTMEGITTGRTMGDIAKEIQRQNQVSASKAMVIARTEVARTASVLTQVRAEHAGATHYIWRTSRDADVRDSHREMEGTVIAFADPPTTDGMVGHAGQLINCRCFCQPLFDEE